MEEEEEDSEDSLNEEEERHCLKVEEKMRVEKERKERDARMRKEKMKDWKVMEINIGVINKKGEWVKSEKDVHRLTLTKRLYVNREGDTVEEWEKDWERRKEWAITETRKDVESGKWDEK
ncbi:hypothetical protein CgunFtcFv8_026261 [Champsocephalus gunnari]|uniref:Uncharacterized protein n=1 Tax=Champsocephalus gunnari TaxID=52237 RepID=A0AAN8CFW0_CHAGU|nr:hypothetical protein CgunFtcFv8_026261 [Champsocephalus gunnari]